MAANGAGRRTTSTSAGEDEQGLQRTSQDKPPLLFRCGSGLMLLVSAVGGTMLAWHVPGMVQASGSRSGRKDEWSLGSTLTLNLLLNILLNLLLNSP